VSATPARSAAEAVSAATLSRRLQEGTREVHEAVERTASFNRLIVVRLPAAADAPPGASGHLARARADYLEVYRRFLVASHGFEAAVDTVIAESPARAEAGSRGYPREEHAPTALIRDDLRTLFGEPALAGLGVMAGLPPARTLAELVGTEYVRRGSRAGGAFIAGIVRANLGLTPGTGASFLMQYGRQTRSVIATFKDWADGLALSDGETGAAVERAIATFEAVQAWHAQLDERFARSR
jgi:heme oxygenase